MRHHEAAGATPVIGYEGRMAAMADPQTQPSTPSTDTSATPPPAPSTPPADQPPASADPSAASADGEPDLGDAGKKALDAERKARRDADARAARLERELQAAKTAQLSEHERAVEEARQQGRTEAQTETNKVLLRAEATARAAGKLQDPRDAPAMLAEMDKSGLERFLDDAGNIDGDAIVAALDELVTAKPYLAVQAAPPPTDPTPSSPPAGSVPPGPRGSDPVKFKRSQLRDPAFYEANRAAILKASAAGLIEDD